jgi:hypothetical protein
MKDLQRCCGEFQVALMKDERRSRRSRRGSEGWKPMRGVVEVDRKEETRRNVGGMIWLSGPVWWRRSKKRLMDSSLIMPTAGI